VSDFCDESVSSLSSRKAVAQLLIGKNDLQIAVSNMKIPTQDTACAQIPCAANTAKAAIVDWQWMATDNILFVRLKKYIFCSRRQ